MQQHIERCVSPTTSRIFSPYLFQNDRAGDGFQKRFNTTAVEMKSRKGNIVHSEKDYFSMAFIGWWLLLYFRREWRSSWPSRSSSSPAVYAQRRAGRPCGCINSTCTGTAFYEGWLRHDRYDSIRFHSGWRMQPHDNDRHIVQQHQHPQAGQSLSRRSNQKRSGGVMDDESGGRTTTHKDGKKEG